MNDRSRLIETAPETAVPAVCSQDTVEVRTRRADTRSQPMALDNGTSAEAAARASTTKLSTVQRAVMILLRERAATDEELSARYNARGGPDYPKVTDQRLRTARAALVRAGRVRDSGALAWTTLGNRCTLWEVT